MDYNWDVPILRPPSELDLYTKHFSCIFLAGPIQGAPEWQKQAERMLGMAVSKVMARSKYYIANPRRDIGRSADFTEQLYREQVLWEHFHLRRAQHSGVILFWLAKEEEHDPSRAYAQTTRFELGEALRGNKGYDRVVVGIEPGFSGSRYIRLTIEEKYPKVPIMDTLSDTCMQAVTFLGRQY